MSALLYGKKTITNRIGQNIVVIVEQKEGQNGLVFIAHGLGGFKEQPSIQAVADVFIQHGYVVVRYDATNSIGESGGAMAEATVTNYHHDLEDVILWSQQQLWYQEPFVLVGHSLGGMAITLYAEEHAEKVRALAPLSTVVSGEELLRSYDAQDLALWQQRGYREWESMSKPGVIKRLNWAFAEDGRKYTLIPNASKLVMPVLMVVGELDARCPVQHEKKLFDVLPGKKDFHIVPGAPHTFCTKTHLSQLRRIISGWVARL